MGSKRGNFARDLKFSDTFPSEVGTDMRRCVCPVCLSMEIMDSSRRWWEYGHKKSPSRNGVVPGWALLNTGRLRAGLMGYRGGQGSGVRGQGSGVRSQESGVRSQESGVRAESGGGWTNIHIYTLRSCVSRAKLDGCTVFLRKVAGEGLWGGRRDIRRSRDGGCRQGSRCLGMGDGRGAERETMSQERRPRRRLHKKRRRADEISGQGAG